jgi:hypothetical protein
MKDLPVLPGVMEQRRNGFVHDPARLQAELILEQEEKVNVEGPEG